MTDEVVKILERAAAKYADDLALRAVGENTPGKEKTLKAIKKIVANAYYCGAAELWEVLEKSKQAKL